LPAPLRTASDAGSWLPSVRLPTRLLNVN
jgi:hypothetical protein